MQSAMVLKKIFLIAVVVLLSTATGVTEAASEQDVLSNTSFDFDTSQLLNQQSSSSEQSPNNKLQSGQYVNKNRNGRLLPGEQRIEYLLPSSEKNLPPPYGANLFAGGYESERVDGINEDYLVAPGDKVSIWLWGAINFAEVVTVDNQGNIFLPNIGPVHLANVRASQVNKVVTSKIKQIYKSNVEVYVNLLSPTPIAVFVSGPVIRPGQYAGMPSDSLLYYLNRAGGIDAERGSYRKISVLRDGKPVQEFDLYDFLKKGQIPDFNFKDKDVIFVAEQGATVTVGEGARNPFRFEFKNNSAKGSELTTYARPLSKVSHVGVAGTREDGPFSVYLPFKKFTNFVLKDGDKLLFNDDWDAQIYDIKVSGSHLGPSHYTVDKSTKLYDLLNHVEIDPELADFENIYLLRKSVAKKQKEMIDQSLERLERSVYTAPVQSTGEGTIRTQEARLVSDFVKRAKQIEPLGKVIVSENGKLANILLEQGDEIVIPQKSNLVHVGGEVLLPQSVVYNDNASIEDYIAWAGGYSERANHQRILVIHANGLVSYIENPNSGWLRNSKGKDVIKPGDQVLVLPKVDAKIMQSVKDMTQIIYQIAVAANVALD